MPKTPKALETLPPLIQAELRNLGENLMIARKRRHEPRRDWAARIGVSEPTLMRMEHGDPSVSMGIYATALWLLGRSGSIAELAAPELDRGALEQEVRLAQKRSVRKPASIQQKLTAYDEKSDDKKSDAGRDE